MVQLLCEGVGISDRITIYRLKGYKKLKKINYIGRSLIRSCTLLTAFFILLLCVSCSSDGYVNIDSQVGAHYLMFKTLTDNHADVGRFSNLAFDANSTSLSADENAELSGLIKKYCEEKNVKYFEMSMSGLRSSGKIVNGMYGDEFEDGYLLTYSFTEWIEDDDGDCYTGEITLWHSGMDAVGCLRFRIRKNSKGWYIDDSDGQPGYSVMIS